MSIILPPIASSLPERLARVRKSMQAEDLAAFVSFGQADCRYLTGFTGEAASVVVTMDDLILVTDSRFTVQAADEAPAVRLALAVEHQDDQLPGLLREAVGGVERVGIDGDHLTVKRWERLRQSLSEKPEVAFTVTSELVSRCRMVKFPDELAALRAAGRLATEAFAYLENTAVVGRSELGVALDLEFYLREHGSEGIPFPFIVAAGARGAMPHGQASGALIERDQLIVVDIGATVAGYASDMTRTYATGVLSGELAEAYRVVQAAQTRARSRVRAGISGRDLDGMARGVMEEAGKADLFLHSLGHGVGLEVHEGPRLSTRSEDILSEAMVVTIEPGAYLTGLGGVRIEDTVVVTAEGAEVLTEWPRDLKLHG
jgi:Xaa-Pro aminopeptidase